LAQGAIFHPSLGSLKKKQACVELGINCKDLSVIKNDYILFSILNNGKISLFIFLNVIFLK